jgi:protein-disulfide isomerase
MQTITQRVRTLLGKIHFTTPVAIIIAAIILGSSHIAYGLLSAPTEAKELFKGRMIDQTDLATGNTNSKVVVLEYLDTECYYCGQLFPTMSKIREEYAGKVTFVYRYFPLTEIHPHAFDEARAVYCVGKSLGAKKREDYINELFTYKLSKKNMVLPDGGKEAIAKNVGMNEKDLTTCMADTETANVINASREDGIGAGVEGTPATFILVKTRKGYELVTKVDGARQYEYIKAAIEEALAR